MNVNKALKSINDLDADKSDTEIEIEPTYTKPSIDPLGEVTNAN